MLAKTAVVAALSWSVPLVGGNAGQSEKAVETIVFIRHGEKPNGGFGQLNCQGLNRALALAPIIAKSFGRPDAIFAPNPSRPKEDAGRLYDYIRPLATIEPTAIWFGLPVDVISTSRIEKAYRPHSRIGACPITTYCFLSPGSTSKSRP